MRHWRLLLAAIALVLWVGPLEGQGRGDLSRMSEWTDAELRQEFRELRRAIDSVSRSERMLQRRVDSLTLSIVALDLAHQRAHARPATPPPPVLLETRAGEDYAPPTYREMQRFTVDGWTIPRERVSNITAGVTAAAWLASVLRLGALGELHHFYYGLALYLWPDAPAWAKGLGLAVMADDAVQHAVQLRDPDYRSPMHRGAYWLIYRVGA